MSIQCLSCAALLRIRLYVYIRVITIITVCLYIRVITILTVCVHQSHSYCVCVCTSESSYSYCVCVHQSQNYSYCVYIGVRTIFTLCVYIRVRTIVTVCVLTFLDYNFACEVAHVANLKKKKPFHALGILSIWCYKHFYRLIGTQWEMLSTLLSSLSQEFFSWYS